MKLCIPVNSPNGLESLLEPHLPRAEHLLFFDTETRSFEQISLRETSPGTGGDIEINAVLCGSINRVTLRTLIEQGISVYGTEAQTVAQAIAQYENGELEAAVVAPGAGAGGGCGCSGGHGEAGGGQGCHGEGGGCGGHGHDHGEHHCLSAGGGCGAHEDGGCCASHAAAGAAPAERPCGDGLRIAVTSQNRKTVTEHAGKCRKFWIYDVKQGQVTGKTLLELPIEQSFHESPAGQAHPLDAVDVLITAGIGSGLQQRLQQRGIQSVVTNEENPDQAVAVFLAGELDRTSTTMA
jgi:predicted Fe-Mo cluster-binding NifX family protein